MPKKPPTPEKHFSDALCSMSDLFKEGKITEPMFLNFAADIIRQRSEQLPQPKKA